jgi:hypothetical protein
MSKFTKYLSSQAIMAEETVYSLVKTGDYGEKILTPMLDWNYFKKYIPERVELIQQKGGKLFPGSSGWDQLGVDIFFEWEGITIALDITCGSSTVIKNKRKKMTALQPFLPVDKTGILVVRREFSKWEWEDFLLTIYDSDDIIDHRWV